MFGMDLAFVMPEDMVYANEYRLKPFAVEHVSDPHVFKFERVESLAPPTGNCVHHQPDFYVYEDGNRQIRYIGETKTSWENAFIRATHADKEHHIQLTRSSFPERIGTKTVLTSVPVEHLVMENHGVILHCAYIERNGKSILFTAPSGTGKSTQAELWKQYRNAEIINGDRAAVRIADGTILAEGVPFCGSSTYCENRSLPLEAIVYLAQAPRTTVRRMRGYEAFARVWEGVAVNTWDKGDLELASDTVKRIAENIPVYHMPCTPDESAVIALEQELRKLVNR